MKDVCAEPPWETVLGYWLGAELSSFLDWRLLYLLSPAPTFLESKGQTPFCCHSPPALGHQNFTSCFKVLFIWRSCWHALLKQPALWRRVDAALHPFPELSFSPTALCASFQPKCSTWKALPFPQILTGPFSTVCSVFSSWVSSRYNTSDRNVQTWKACTWNQETLQVFSSAVYGGVTWVGLDILSLALLPTRRGPELAHPASWNLVKKIWYGQVLRKFQIS